MKSMMLNISNAQKLLKEYFHYDDFRPNQKQVIQHLVTHQSDALIIMPTGGGKSILYTIPALLFDGLTIIISPLIALMQDQVFSLQAKGIKADYLSHDHNQFSKIRNNPEALKLLFVSPERFVHPEFFAWLKTINNPFIAIDEAHTFTEYGLSFRASYRKLFEHIQELKTLRSITLIALTATASDFIYQDLLKHHKFEKVFQFKTFRKNLKIGIKAFKSNEEKNKELYTQFHENTTTLIYTLSRREAEKIYYRNGMRLKQLRYYHSKITPEDKQDILKGFIHNDIKLIASTTAFGMGIDKPDVRFVYHAELPTSIEDYSQQIGRAGRDGKDSEVVLYFSQEELLQREEMLNNSSDSLEKELHALNNGIITKNQGVKNLFLIRGLISPVDSSPQEIHIHHENTSYPFLKHLLKCIKNENNIKKIATSLHTEPWIIEDSLHYLREKGFIEFKQKHHAIHSFNFEEELKALKEDDAIKKEKFQALKDYINTKECRHKWLGSYFSSPIDDCKTMCDNCLEKYQDQNINKKENHAS